MKDIKYIEIYNEVFANWKTYSQKAGHWFGARSKPISVASQIIRKYRIDPLTASKIARSVSLAKSCGF